MPFPLLKLPLLALIVVIQRMDTLERVSIIHTSKRTRRVTKYANKSQSIIFRIDHNGQFEESVAFGSNKEKMIRRPHNWDAETDKEKRINNIITWFADSFRSVSLSFSFYKETAELSCQILERAKNHGIRFENVLCLLPIESAKPTRRLMNVCKDAARFEVSIDFDGVLEGLSYLSVDDLSIICTGNVWATHNNLFDLRNCSRVFIMVHHLGSQVLNGFLKNWLQAPTSRIQKLKMFDKCLINAQVVMDGIDTEEIRPNEVWQIQRRDGTRADIHVYTNYFNFNVSTV